ncbi:MAG: sodium:solute symporter family transporter [Eubacterium ramulus]
MLVDLLPGWISAVLLAALLAAILSTFAMTSLTPSTIWVNDIYLGYINPESNSETGNKCDKNPHRHSGGMCNDHINCITDDS